MAAKWSPGQWLHGAQRTWGALAKSGVWIAAAVGGFLVPPPVGSEQFDSGNWTRLAQFVIIVVIGLLLVITSRRQRKKDAALWSWVAAGALVLSLTAFFSYRTCAERWTTTYAGDPVVTGHTLTELGAEHLEAYPNITPETLVEDFAGRLDAIWTPSSIASRHLKLSLLYLGCLPLFTLAMLAMIQALNCSKRKR